ncbi:MAG: cyclic nucleotide-binding domain-containing protein [Myxococcota bacterium]
MHPRIATILSGMPLARALSDGDRAKLAGIATLEELHAGATIFREGDDSAAVYLVAEGRISLSMRLPGRPEVTLLTLGPGELAGWSALTGAPLVVATGRAVERVVLIRLPRDSLLALCDQDHDIGYAVIRLAFGEVTRRLQETRLQLLDMFATRDRGAS